MHADCRPKINKRKAYCTKEGSIVVISETIYRCEGWGDTPLSPPLAVRIPGLPVLYC